MIPYALLAAKEEIRAKLHEISPDLDSPPIEHPPRAIAADLAMPVFPLARLWRKAPPVIAQEIAGRLAWDPDGLVRDCEAAGGYVNFRLHADRYADRVMAEIAAAGSDYGENDRGAGRTVVVDYSSPNIGKPMSVGHIRSTIIGESLVRLYRRSGYRTVGINFLGDWGTQYGKLTYAFQRWGDEAALQSAPIQELLRVYVKFHDEAEADESLEAKGREWFARLEAGDTDALALWGHLRDLSIREFERIYDRLGIRFDVWSGESEFHGPPADRVIREALEKGIARQDQGALIVPLEEYGLSAPILLRKSNGTTSYETRDLGAMLHRIDTYHPAQILYCVANEQTFRFQQIFKALELLGYSETKPVHVSFGFMSLPEGRMSTRRGNIILLEDLLDEAIERAGRIIEEKNPDLSVEERADVARIVGLGAVTYSDLSQTRVKDVTFDWDRMLAFDGDSAPYLQYTYVRCRSIRRRSGAGALPFDGAALDAPEEADLIRALARFPEWVAAAADEYAPHVVANYLFALAQQFQGFYEKVPVLRAATSQQVANRVALVDAVATVLRAGLYLLGIECPERM